MTSNGQWYKTQVVLIFKPWNLTIYFALKIWPLTRTLLWTFGILCAKATNYCITFNKSPKPFSNVSIQMWGSKNVFYKILKYFALNINLNCTQQLSLSLLFLIVSLSLSQSAIVINISTVKFNNNFFQEISPRIRTNFIMYHKKYDL